MNCHKYRDDDFRSGKQWRAILCVIGTLLGVFPMLLDAAEGPFDNSHLNAPISYTGPVFELSHNYPHSIEQPPPPMPWKNALNGQPISKATAGAYASALREAVSADMQVLVSNYPAWNPNVRGWYNQPWLSTSAT